MMLIYKVTEIYCTGIEVETKYFQFEKTANEYFYKTLEELKKTMPLVKKEDIKIPLFSWFEDDEVKYDEEEEPIMIYEPNPNQEDFVRSATLKYWESYDTDTDIMAGAEMKQMILQMTKHELISE